MQAVQHNLMHAISFHDGVEKRHVGGDMKRKGRPDPYAYIPLNRQMLNKRKKAKLSGRFNNLIKAAKKGAKSGSTAPSKKKHKH